MPNADAELPDLAIFGYGSLICPASISRTLGRDVSPCELAVTRLHGYRRTWDLVDVVVDADNQPQRLVFLNLQPDPSASTIGVCFPVTPQELTRFDQRERNYDRVDVTDQIEPNVARSVLTYVGRPEHLVQGDDALVATSYEATLEEGLRYWGPQFEHEFLRSTEPHQFPPLQGPYRFATPAP